jgi:hypothetical protein
MKVMMIDFDNYAGLREDVYAEIVTPNVWDVHCWSGDMIRYYQENGYHVVLLVANNLATKYRYKSKPSPKSTDIIDRLCKETDIRHYFMDCDKSGVIDGRYSSSADNWKHYKVSTDESALQYAINYVRSFQPEEFFVTADSRTIKEDCEDLGVTYTNIDEVHSIALGIR